MVSLNLVLSTNLANSLSFRKPWDFGHLKSQGFWMQGSLTHLGSESDDSPGTGHDLPCFFLMVCF